VTIGVFLSNTNSLDAFVVPLEIRSITPGSFIAGAFDLAVTPGSRVAALSPPFGFVDLERAAPLANACSGPVSHTFGSGTAVDFVSPDGAMIGGQRALGPALLGGADPVGTANASLMLTFNVTGTPGTFEIDTCCFSPANHLMFIESTLSAVSPSFTKGIVRITSCECDCHGDPVCDHVQDVLDVVQTIAVAFRGAPRIPDPNSACPYETTDVDCSGGTDIIDVVRMVNVSFRGASALTEICNPCP
jgi:hypothetical protein